MPDFPTEYQSILARLNSIEPNQYAQSRNYLNGAVTRLSPYLTHGVLSTRDVGNVALTKSGYRASEVLLKELAWHDYYYASWNELGDAIFSDLRYPQPFNRFPDMPAAVASATTSIRAIDESVTELLNTGYLHNHSRLWVAMLCCNIAQTAWWNPSRWMYYHLLDGNLASNTLSWQWVAGSTRQEPYFANQENLNTFSGSVQRDTFLDFSTEALANRPIPQLLEPRTTPPLQTTLPESPAVEVSGEVLLYHAWSLDPRWHQHDSRPRILLLEPSHFAKFPMSQKRVDFILALAKNIPGLRVVVSDFAEFAAKNPEARCTYIHYPAIRHWRGLSELPERLFTANRPLTSQWSFSKFWSHRVISLNTDANA